MRKILNEFLRQKAMSRLAMSTLRNNIYKKALSKRFALKY